MQLHDKRIQLALQWIPGHSNIKGNDVADAIAQSSHRLPKVQTKPLELPEIETIVKSTLRAHYSEIWKIKAQSTQYGSVYSSFTHNNPLTRNRKLEKVLTRLRSGHIGLRQHLHRLHMADSKYCRHCPQEAETTEHYLIYCPFYHKERLDLRESLAKLSIHTFDLKTILGGGPYKDDLQLKIKKLLLKFITKTNKLHELLHH